MVVLAHLDTQDTRDDRGERKGRKFRLIKRLMERGWSDEQVRSLFRCIDWMMDLPEPLANEFWDEVKQYKEEKKMPFITTPERYGRIESRIEDIEAILSLKYPDAAGSLMADIRLIKDEKQLAQILRAAVTAGKPDELRSLWSNESSS
jgi:hypothetical protein